MGHAGRGKDEIHTRIHFLEHVIPQNVEELVSYDHLSISDVKAMQKVILQQRAELKTLKWVMGEEED